MLPSMGERKDNTVEIGGGGDPLEPPPPWSPSSAAFPDADFSFSL